MFVQKKETNKAHQLKHKRDRDLLPTDVIPEGIYCYRAKYYADEDQWYKVFCPYWDIIKWLPSQCNGYCAYLKQSDVDIGNGMLWDACKECGINMGELFDD